MNKKDMIRKQQEVQIARKKIKIDKVVELHWKRLEGQSERIERAYAHVGRIQQHGPPRDYALLGRNPNNGSIYLGEINPETMCFEAYDKDAAALYSYARNHVIKEIAVPDSQLEKLLPYDVLLNRYDFEIKQEIIPSDKSEQEK